MGAREWRLLIFNKLVWEIGGSYWPFILRDGGISLWKYAVAAASASVASE